MLKAQYFKSYYQFVIISIFQFLNGGFERPNEMTDFSSICGVLSL